VKSLRGIASLLLLVLLLGTLLTPDLKVAAVWTGKTIEIRGDGSVVPSDAPIKRVGNTYYVTEDMIIENTSGIAIEKDNIILDGNNHSITGSGSGNGVCLHVEAKNVIVRNMVIRGFDNGIALYSSHNTISGNNITNNGDGIWLIYSSDSAIFHNNFVNNTQQVYYNSSTKTNAWDNGYPSGGNYWSDYKGIDEKSGPNQDQPGSDGIGDTPYSIKEGVVDRYPLMKPWGTKKPPSSVPLPQATPSQGVPPYKAGDWIRYRCVAEGRGMAGSVKCEWTIEIRIEEVNGLHVKYSIKEKPVSGDGLCTLLDPRLEGEISDDLSSPQGFFLVNPNDTDISHTERYAYGNITFTYYKGVLVNYSISSITPAGLFFSTEQSEISLIDTSIEELKGAPAGPNIAGLLILLIIVVAAVVSISFVLIRVKHRHVAPPPPPPP
jgi:parallel beta-helix repeat protein